MKNASISGDRINSKSIAYSVAILTSIIYGAWYVSFSLLANASSSSVSPLFPLLIIWSVSASIAFIFTAKERAFVHSIKNMAFPMLSGIFFVAGNYLFYVTTRQIGIPFSSSFATAEILVFSALLFLFSKERKTTHYVLGALMISIGLIIESAKLQNSAIVFNTPLIIYGVAIAVLFGIATYFYYLSTKKIESKSAIIFYTQATEAVLFLVLFLVFYNKIQLPLLTTQYLAFAVFVGAFLFVAFFTESIMMKMLGRFKEGTVATGYILSDLQLIPVMAYAIIAQPSSFIGFVPGMAIIMLGMIWLDWK